MMKFVNHGGGVMKVKAGDRVAQGVFVPYGITYDDEVDTVRNGGFGSDVKVIDEIQTKLLSVKLFCKYLDIGQTTARKLLPEPNCPYRFRIGGKIFAHKTIPDKWIDSNTGI